MLPDFAKFGLNSRNYRFLKIRVHNLLANLVAIHETIRDTHRLSYPDNEWQGSSHFYFL
jgi:hypothetical protein